MMPKSEAEAKSIREICQMFRFYMAPSFEGEANTSRTFIVPATFDIEYRLIGGGENNFLNKIMIILDQAKIDNIKLPFKNYDDLTAYFKIGENRGSLEDYIKRFDITLCVMQTPKALSRFAYELIEDVSKENVRYIEVRYSPILHTKKGMALEEAIESVRKGLKRGEKDFGVKSGIIVCGIRHISPEASLKLADLAVRYKNRGVVGFDLAGSEENFPAKEHREAFYLIRNNNVNATIHAGEAYGPSSIHQAIHQCGANRIGHGTRLKEDKNLMDYVIDHRITLEICLTSNWQTRSIRSLYYHCLLYTSPSPRDLSTSRMPSSA